MTKPTDQPGDEDEPREVRFVNALIRHRRLVVALFLAVAALATYGATRLQPAGDITAFIGDDAGRAHREATDVLKRFGTLDSLLIDVSSSGVDQSQTELEATADEVVAALKATSLFKSVHFRSVPEAQKQLRETLFTQRFRLFAAPTDLDSALDGAARELMLPGGFDSMVARDPLQHRFALADTLRSAVPKLNVEASSTTLLSRDGAHALIVAQPIARALDVQEGRNLLRQIESVVPEHTSVEVLGAHVFAEAAATGIKRDVRLTLAISIGLTLLLFGLVFRHPAPVFAVMIPVGFGGLVAAGAFGLFGWPIHGITLGFSAIIIGVGVDYGAHLVMHIRAAGRARASAAGLVLPSIVAGAVTTLVALATLWFGSTRALSELAQFTAIGIIASLAACIGLIPLAADLLGSDRLVPESATAVSYRPRSVPFARGTLALFLLVAATLALGVPDMRFDGDVRNLDAQPDHVRALEQRFAERYQNPRFPTLIVTRAESLDGVLERGDRIAKTLAHAESQGHIGSFVSLSTVLPSLARQKSALMSYQGTDFRNRLLDAANARDFSAGVFEPMFVDLATARATAPLTPDSLRGTPLGPLVARSLHEHAGQHELLSIAYMSGAGSPGKELPAQLRDALTVDGNTTVISQAGLATAAVGQIQSKAARLSVVALAMVLLILVFYYRSIRVALFAICPVLFGFLSMFGLSGWLDIPLNIVSIGAFALVAGVGVDYGIFVTDAALRASKSSEHSPHVGLARRAVLVAALTTLVGFGTLLLANSPVMWSIGFAVAVGVVGSLLAAVLGLPALWAVTGGIGGRACSSCAGRMRPTRDRSAVLQLTIIVVLFWVVLLAWLTGARTADSDVLILALALDLVCGGWLIWRLHRRPRHCDRCRPGSRTDASLAYSSP
ncbi:MAG: putative exporter [Myxococcota bacterium]